MGNNAHSYWSTVNGITERLKALHGPGDRSMRDMAKVLSHEFEVPLSRNAIISKLRRLGLAGKNGKKKRKLKPPPKPKAKPLRAVQFTYYPPKPPKMIGLGVPLSQLHSNNCHFPIVGDRAPYLFCGLDVEEGCRLYCAAHCRLSFKPNRINHGPSSAKSPPPLRNVRPAVRRFS